MNVDRMCMRVPDSTYFSPPFIYRRMSRGCPSFIRLCFSSLSSSVVILLSPGDTFGGREGDGRCNFSPLKERTRGKKKRKNASSVS